jgi:hypothetical protein
VAAKFSVVGSFFMPSRNLFVAVGDVIEGNVKAGMTVAVTLSTVQVTTPIQGVEVITVDFRDQAYSGLGFGFDDPDELEFWSALRIGGEVLEIAD